MKLQNLNCGTRETTLRHGRIAFHKQHDRRGLDGRLELLPRFLGQPPACCRQALSSPDGPRELPITDQHAAESIRNHASLTEGLTRFRSILGGVDGRWISGFGCRSREHGRN